MNKTFCSEELRFNNTHYSQNDIAGILLKYF